MTEERVSDATLTPIPHLQSVTLQPGDVIVCSVDFALTVSAREAMRTEISQRMQGHPVVVLSGGNPRLSVWNEAREPMLAMLIKAMQMMRAEIAELRKMLTEDEDPPEGKTLDGEPAGRARDQFQAL